MSDIWLPPMAQNGHNKEAEEVLAYKMGYRDVRYHQSDAERKHMEDRSTRSWHHCRPWSILIAAMGCHWKPGSWQRVLDMMHHTQAQGYYVALQEIMDRCKEPYDALGAMRNEALMKARQGFEWILYVDNDVLPEKDALIRMLNWDMPIVAPWVEEPGSGKPLHGPSPQKNSGLRQIRWCVLSMLLFRTAVFNSFIGGEFWNNAIGADEGYHFQKLWDVGHRPYLDTNVQVPVAQIPTYPLATNRMAEQEAKSFWDKRKEWLLEPPNRAPIDINDPHQRLGEYMPWHDEPPSPWGKIPQLALIMRGGTG